VTLTDEQRLRLVLATMCEKHGDATDLVVSVVRELLQCHWGLSNVLVCNAAPQDRHVDKDKLDMVTLRVCANNNGDDPTTTYGIRLSHVLLDTEMMVPTMLADLHPRHETT
jgi:hypothetical protein